ncbi:complement factor D [Ornithorhynchus anatinus]|uniref:Complement factor D n=1 Tax=Ornithorhynchus anatinus TaxID=9258 RepID=A0A6I8N914_ORNAN|nr:complement factor D [Ornithorhynchus anatinus]
MESHGFRWSWFLLVLSIAACGAHPRGRILGGWEATPNLLPYMASLQQAGKHVCGGFLISDQWVLSAAHCAEEMKDGELQVLLGAHSLSQPESSKHLYVVQAVIPHPDSHPDNNDHDLLLLKLAQKVTLSERVKPLAFQRVDRDLQGGTLCQVAGWGFTNNLGKKPDKLQQVNLPIMPRAICNLRQHYDNEITEKMMCTESRKKDTCKGDSGGPLVCNGVAEAVVTSGSRVCGNWKKPGIYTRIASYVSWIDDVMARGG